ncbi:MAG: sigma 54-interacting transcriptional regulator [Tissierellales bacterium]|jgi:transcriptional regulatory protein LevR/transcriptional regulator with AAA-type ATPase domain|nr:sigma 54-interacting transcriptional regulator [Tissierellales bacterium]
MKSIDRVLNYIRIQFESSEDMEKGHSLENIGIDAREVAENLGIQRSNASALLNQLVKEEKLVKLIGRPVRFIDSRVIADDMLKRYGYEWSSENVVSFSAQNSGNIRVFDELIGFRDSLRVAIEQAKAAMLYPPNGLHTLLTGESGVGKTTFAKKMHLYAKKKRNVEFPFVSFNCSDYYNNPQLLMSHLFGHIKGAYTGADSDKVGLIEEANEGVLFLDEVHRLPPDGQEMLFYLMDQGLYRRMGEAGYKRKSRVLVIAATTENPQEVLLRTFLRRLPVMIHLPNLKEKPISERLEMIVSIFEREVEQIGKTISIVPEVMKALLIYECSGNIGQLESDIKLLCARVFLNSIQNESNCMEVEFSMLPENIKEAVFNIVNLPKMEQNFLNRIKKPWVIDGVFRDCLSSSSLYEDILNKYESYKNEGMDIKLIDQRITESIYGHYEREIEEIKECHEVLNIRALYKIVEREVADISVDLTKNITCEKDVDFDGSLMFGLALHLQALLERLRAGKTISNHNLLSIKEMYPEYYEISGKWVKNIESAFGIEIPEDERGFLTLLIDKHLKKEHAKNISETGLLVIAHGEKTATSMAGVVNSLLNTDCVKSIDMPLDQSVRVTYENTVKLIKSYSNKEWLILVDMGSLIHFGDQLMGELGLPVRVIPNVSTPMILEATRKISYGDVGLEAIYNQMIKREKIVRKKAILCLCVTGEGAGKLVKNVLEQLIKDTGNEKQLRIIAASYEHVNGNKAYLSRLKEDYEFIAYVGTVDVNIDIPYFPVQNILRKKGQNELLKLIEVKVNEIERIQDKQSSMLKSAEKILEEYLLLINPKLAIAHIDKFLNQLELANQMDEDQLVNFIIHIGCALERVVRGEHIVFDDKEAFVDENKYVFDKVKREIEKLEDVYRFKINEDEICYMVKIINMY